MISYRPSRLMTHRGEHDLRVALADTFQSRLFGLMFRRDLPNHPQPHGLLIQGCTSVHTCFMRFAIDVVYLDAGCRVSGCVEHLRPWRASFGASGLKRGNPHTAYGRTRHTLELPAGTVARLGIAPGDRLFSDAPPLFTDREAAHA